MTTPTQTTEEPIEVLPGGGSANLSGCGRKATPNQVAEYFKDRFAKFITNGDG